MVPGPGIDAFLVWHPKDHRITNSSKTLRHGIQETAFPAHRWPSSEGNSSNYMSKAFLRVDLEWACRVTPEQYFWEASCMIDWQWKYWTREWVGTWCAKRYERPAGSNKNVACPRCPRACGQVSHLQQLIYSYLKLFKSFKICTFHIYTILGRE